MKVRHVLQQLFNQAPIAHSFLMVFLFFGGLILTIKPDDGKIHLISILPSVLVMAIVGMAIGKALENNRQTYLWSTNLDYQKLHEKVLIILPLALCAILMLFVILFGSGNESFVLLGLIVLYIMVLTHNSQNASSKLFLIYFPIMLLIQTKGKPDSLFSGNYGLLIIFAFYGIILFDSIVKYRKNKGYIDERNTKKPKGKLLIHRFKMLKPNYIKKDVGLSLSENGLTFPLYGVMLGIIVVGYTVIMNIFLVNEVKISIVLTLMFMMNFLMGFSFKFNMKQVKKYAHVFEGQNHAGIKNQLIKAMDKRVLLNNLSFIIIILSFMFFLDLPFNKLELIVTLFISLIFVFNTYLLVMSVKTDTKTEVGLVLVITYAILFAIVHALAVAYKESFFSWSFDLGVLIFTVLIRLLAEREFKRVKFEDLRF